MRPQVVITTLLLALAVCGGAWLVSRATPKPVGSISAANPAPVQPDATAPTAASAPPSSSAAFSTPTTPPSPALAVNNPALSLAPNTEPETNHDLYVFDRDAELLKVAREGGPDALNTIWSETSNPDKEIRAGAVEALIQLGDQSASPRLRDLAAHTEDAQEKVDIIAAADQLDLPPMGSAAANKQTNQ